MTEQERQKREVWARDAFGRLTQELDVTARLRFATDEDLPEGEGGNYWFLTDTVTINLDHAVTELDTEFLVAHEVRHAYQHEDAPEFVMFSVYIDSQREGKDDEYTLYLSSPVEVDANAYATKWVEARFPDRIMPDSVKRMLEAETKEAFLQVQDEAIRHAYWITRAHYQRRGLNLSEVEMNRGFYVH